ncbi:LysR family transcriptional regulator [Rhizobium sp. KVB221]|uniref:LysR family transcriptional regulator n=1 Tax=Rhizobium setariae TaxID=2801340 RepID=A0A936YK78_9HYPH|nr:LysR substrate-binding domain-containing protein [Rhizobium setariae]MBL0371830.1 LysR family transcriptional regulator [Rhizobium setariae]
MKNLNTVHLNGLRALEAVGRLGSLQAAADELGVSAGAVSQQINKAEAQLGHLIFERRPKGLVATDIGRPVLGRLTEGFGKLSEGVGLAQRRDTNCLTISVAPVFAARWLVRRLESFARQFPDIVLRIDATTRLIDPAISDIDLGIRVGMGEWPDVVSEPILTQQVFPVVAPSLATELKTPRDILSMPAVIDSKAMFDWSVWLDVAGLAGEKMNARHVLNEASLCLDAVIAGQGVMLAWQTLTVDAILEGRLAVPFKIRAKTGYGHYFATARDQRESRKIKVFKAWMRAEMASSMDALETSFQ